LAGFLLVFLEGTNYLLDVYTVYAGAALSINICARSLLAAGLAAAARYTFRGMGPEWACTFLALVSVVMLPVPMVLYKFGLRLRANSPWTPKLLSGYGRNSTSPVEGFPQDVLK
jgi:hypothetical protein